MKAGMLRDRLKVYERQTGRDETGAPIDEWVLCAELWGSAQIITGRERWANEHTVNDYTAAVSIRARDDLRTDMRVVVGNRTLQIQAIIDPTNRRKELRLLCVDYDG